MRSAESAGSVSIFDGPSGAAKAADDRSRNRPAAARRTCMETPSDGFGRSAGILARVRYPSARGGPMRARMIASTIFLAAAVSRRASADPETVHFPSEDGKTRLVGYLFRPSGAG